MPESVRASAPAKINLWLDVLGKRADGFHELDTVMLALDWADELHVERAERFALEVRGAAASADIPSDERNLVWRAAQSVWRAGGGVGGLALALEKRVPSQAGLGGGSADAAAAALCAARLLGGPAALQLVQPALAALGSDCAFFAAAPGGVARCRGRGEQVEPLAALPLALEVVIFAPAIACPTPAVYRALAAPPLDEALERPGPPPSPPPGLASACIDTLRASLANALEVAALEAFEELRRVRAWLDARGAEHFRLSGSGSTFFGLFEAPAPDALGSSEAAVVARELERAAARDALALRTVRVARAGPGARILTGS